MIQFTKLIKAKFHSAKQFSKSVQQNLTCKSLSQQIKSQLMFKSNQKFKLLNCKISLGLIGSNILMYALYKNKVLDKEIINENYTLSVDGIKQGNYHTIFTYGFLNTDLKQLMCTILGISTYGVALEHFLGSKNLLKLHIGGIISGGLLHLYKQSQQKKESKFAGTNYGVSCLIGAACIPLFNTAMMKIKKQRINASHIKLLKYAGLSASFLLLNYIILFGDQKIKVNGTAQLVSYLFGASYTSYLFTYLITQLQ